MNDHVHARLCSRSCRLVVLLLSLILAGAMITAQAADNQSAEEEFNTQDLLNKQDDPEQWLLPGKNFAGTRYSLLDEINTDNVDRLRVAWSFSTGAQRGHEGAPLVVGDMMYFVTPYPNFVYAIDLNNPHEVAWKFEPETYSSSIGVACCDSVNRGVFFAEGKIVFNTLGGLVYALDAETGKELWKADNADPSKGQTMTNHPIVVRDKVIVGVSGGEFGVRGYLTAYNLNTGEREWRVYNTGPDDEVGITDRFDPFYDYLKGEDLGVTTWPEDQWKLGGATVWGWFTYDPELDLVYYGTSNPGTWNSSMRRANPDHIEDQVAYANRWATSVMARDPETGELIWAYNWTPHDQWDYDGVNENILVDLEIDGEMRKTLVHFDRNGFAYVLDRATGEVLKADTFGPGVNWAEKIDLETGLPVRNPDKASGKNICPSAMGYKDQQPAAYSPETGLFYVPTNNLCMDYYNTDVSYTAGVPYVGADVKTYPGPGGNRGSFMAWDPIKGERVWEIEEEFSAWGGAMVTAGGLAFYGTMDGWFKAVDIETGDVVWKFPTGSGIIANPMTYIGPDGRQYIAILSGIGGWAGLTVAGDLSLDDPTAALGAVNAFADLGRYTQKGGMLYVFALDGIKEEES